MNSLYLDMMGINKSKSSEKVIKCTQLYMRKGSQIIYILHIQRDLNFFATQHWMKSKVRKKNYDFSNLKNVIINHKKHFIATKMMQ